MSMMPARFPSRLARLKQAIVGRSPTQLAQAAIKTVIAKLKSITPAARAAARADQAFDRRWGTDTSRQIGMNALDFPTELKKASFHYQPSGAHVLDEAVAISGVTPSDYCFIDYGCGKGRIVMLAAATPFARAIGVEYRDRSGLKRVRARREVIVSGGAYGSPQLLQLSGLGPAEHLQEMGIPVLRDMPAVGANLHDHFCVYLMWRCAKPVTFNDLENSWPRKIAAALQYGLFRSGPMAVNAVRTGVLTRTDPRLEQPDLQINLLEWSTLERNKKGVIPHPFSGFTLSPVHLAPEGRGTVRLASPDPFAAPAITFGFLATDYDMRAMLAGIRLARRLAEQPALKAFAMGELVPGEAFSSDADMERFVRETGSTNHHPSSSCAMGIGSNSVVDPRLRVYGVAGLRVADASIMPSVVAGNTNAPSIMIGEKAADMILEDARAAA
jgi:choline dehydrogenase